MKKKAFTNRTSMRVGGLFLLLFLSVSCARSQSATVEQTPVQPQVATEESTLVQPRSTNDEPATGSISGMVVDANDLTPIAGADVSTDPASGVVLTDAQGTYLIKNVLPGKYSVTITKDGYRSSQVRVSVIARLTTSADISLLIVPTATPKPTLAATATITAVATATPPPAAPDSAASTEKTVSVDAAAGWINSGLLLEAGNQVDIVYLSGLWTSGGINALHDANGTALNYICSVENPNSVCLEPIPEAIKGALIARIGNAPPSLIGNGAVFEATSRGPLMLSMNDSIEASDLVDNQGSILVSILVTNVAPDQTITIPQPTSCHGSVAAGPNTLLLLSFENSYEGSAGEHGVPSGTTFTTGIVGQAVQVDSNDALTYDTVDNLNLERGAIDFWIRPNWNGDDELNYTFFEVGDDWFNRIRIMKDGASNLRFILWDSDEETGIEYNVASWRAGEWHRVGVTWESPGNIALLVDCELVASSDSARLPNAISDRIYIGSASWEGQYANAAIDDFHIQNVPFVEYSD